MSQNNIIGHLDFMSSGPNTAGFHLLLQIGNCYYELTITTGLLRATMDQSRAVPSTEPYPYNQFQCCSLLLNYEGFAGLLYCLLLIVIVKVLDVSTIVDHYNDCKRYCCIDQPDTITHLLLAHLLLACCLLMLLLECLARTKGCCFIQEPSMILLLLQEFSETWYCRL